MLPAMANWNSTGFLGLYAEYLDKTEPPKEDKLETLRQLRVRRYEERQARRKKHGGGNDRV